MEVEFVLRPLAGAAILKRPAPRVVRYFIALDVGAVPSRHTLRAGEEGLQPLRRGRVTADIELVHVQDAGETLDRLVGNLFLGGAELVQGCRCHEADEQPENREDDEELAQGKAMLPIPRVGTTGRRAAGGCWQAQAIASAANGLGRHSLLRLAWFVDEHSIVHWN